MSYYHMFHCLTEAILMRTHNICFYGGKIFPDYRQILTTSVCLIVLCMVIVWSSQKTVLLTSELSFMFLVIFFFKTCLIY